MSRGVFSSSSPSSSSSSSSFIVIIIIIIIIQNRRVDSQERPVTKHSSLKVPKDRRKKQSERLKYHGMQNKRTNYKRSTDYNRNLGGVGDR